MKLFHGTPEATAPVVRVDSFWSAEYNLFDGIFASDCYEAAASHGNNKVFAYEVADDKIATSRDLDNNTDAVYAFLREELGTDDVEEIADRIMWDNDSDVDDFSDLLTPRSDVELAGLSWELQRLRGRVAAHLGFDAVEMDDEHGTSYLIVNPAITAE